MEQELILSCELHFRTRLISTTLHAAKRVTTYHTYFRTAHLSEWLIKMLKEPEFDSWRRVWFVWSPSRRSSLESVCGKTIFTADPCSPHTTGSLGVSFSCFLNLVLARLLWRRFVLSQGHYFYKTRENASAESETYSVSISWSENCGYSLWYSVIITQFRLSFSI